MKIRILISFLFLFSLGAQAQEDRFEEMRQQLTLIISESPGLEDPVDLSVTGLPLKEFLRALGNANKVNISVNPAVEGTVVNNFNNVTVAEVLIFLAKQYNLDLDITGNIIQVTNYVPPSVPVIRQVKNIAIEADTSQQLLSMDLKNDSLFKVAKVLTQKTGMNVVFAPGLENKRVSIFLQNVSYDQAMDKMAFANDLKVSRTTDNFYLIEALATKGAEKDERFIDFSNTPGANRFLVDSSLISLEVDNQPLDLVVRNLSLDLGIDYFLYSQLAGNVTLKVDRVTLNELLDKLFYGTEYTYRLQDSVYIIGQRTLEGLRDVRTIYLQHRSVEKFVDVIPSDLKKGVEILEFTELNALVVSGSYPQIMELNDFITSVDISVPLISIEVMIVDYQKNSTTNTGLNAGVGTEPAISQGNVYPDFNYTFNANSVNNLLSSFNGFGALNLGPVTPNFYMTLQFLENNGVLNTRSTPRLSTLNGHEANITIGTTEYYTVEMQQSSGGITPVPIVTRNFQQIQANFTIKIKPIVSGDNQVTLEIEVEQSTFGDRPDETAPPPTVTRKFTSMIRVKNQEMILLGGLEEKRLNDSGTGVPLLSRIPIIKYLFSSRSTNKDKSKLNIFIKPTIIR